VSPHNVWYITKISWEDGRWLEIAHHVIKDGNFLISAELKLQFHWLSSLDWIVLKLNTKNVFDRHESNSSASNFVQSAYRHTAPPNLIFKAFLVHLYGSEQREGVLMISQQ
jgi:hypothetical protein